MDGKQLIQVSDLVAGAQDVMVPALLTPCKSSITGNSDSQFIYSDSTFSKSD